MTAHFIFTAISVAWFLSHLSTGLKKESTPDILAALLIAVLVLGYWLGVAAEKLV